MRDRYERRRGKGRLIKQFVPPFPVWRGEEEKLSPAWSTRRRCQVFRIYPSLRSSLLKRQGCQVAAMAPPLVPQKEEEEMKMGRRRRSPGQINFTLIQFTSFATCDPSYPPALLRSTEAKPGRLDPWRTGEGGVGPNLHKKRITVTRCH